KSRKEDVLSHVVEIQTKVHDPKAVTAACARLNLATPTQGTAQLFSGEASGLLVQLPGWKYPVAIDTLSGAMKYDNYAGAWGDRVELDRFMQMYATEKVKLECRRRGRAVTEEALADGSIRLNIVEGA